MKTACNVVKGDACVANVKFKWLQFRDELRKLTGAFTSMPPAPINPVAPKLSAEEALRRMPYLSSLGSNPEQVCDTLWDIFKSMPSTFKQMDPKKPSDDDLLGALANDVHPWFSRYGVSVPLPWKDYYCVQPDSDDKEVRAATAIALSFFSFVCSRAFCMDTTLLINTPPVSNKVPAPKQQNNQKKSTSQPQPQPQPQASMRQPQSSVGESLRPDSNYPSFQVPSRPPSMDPLFPGTGMTPRPSTSPSPSLSSGDGFSAGDFGQRRGSSPIVAYAEDDMNYDIRLGAASPSRLCLSHSPLGTPSFFGIASPAINGDSIMSPSSLNVDTSTDDGTAKANRDRLL